MTAISLPVLIPKFIRGNVRVHTGDIVGEYTRAMISPDGIFGLRWPPFVPVKHFGKIIEAQVDIATDGRVHRFEIPSLVVHESTMRTERMGLKFRHRDAALQEKLHKLIQTHGYYPVEHTRKHPRIPSTQFTQGFDLRASGVALPSALNPTPQRISYRISNLSTEGLLLQTFDANAQYIRAGDLIETRLSSSSGNTDIPAKLKVYRRLHEIDFTSQKEQWLFGLQFHRLEESTRRQYFKLLQDILTRIKDVA